MVAISAVLGEIASNGLLVETEDQYSVAENAALTQVRGAALVDEPKIINKGNGNLLIRGSHSRASGATFEFLGSNCVVFLGAYSDIGFSSVKLIGNGTTFRVGAFTTIGSLTGMVTNRVSIGDRCMLSARIIIEDSDHHGIFDLDTGVRVNVDQEVKIGNHVWLGRDVRIGKGTEIGGGSVVAQGAIVGGRLEAASVYGGVPARLLRSNIKWSRMKTESWEAMETSSRHEAFMQKLHDLIERCL